MRDKFEQEKEERLAEILQGLALDDRKDQLPQSEVVIEEVPIKECAQPDLCQLCDANKAAYTCPKCNKRYCSLACYKSEKHVACTEKFS